MATRAKHPEQQRWNFDHDPESRPLGCNGLYGKSGAAKHRYRKEPVCDACKASQNHYERELNRGQKYPRVLKPCGTPAAALRHRYNNEPLDLACHEALLAARRKRHAARRARLAA